MLKETLNQEVKYSEVELDFILEYQLSAMISIMSYWFQQEKILPAKHLVGLMSDIMENGMSHMFKV
ncbi:MAG TPA: hypothetical protein DCY20_11310 [Firmicutes bacterium]|nr:hypothetical protein [Bacillota bacterium]